MRYRRTARERITAANRPTSIMVQVAGSGMGMVGGVPGGPPGGVPPGGVPPGGVPPGGDPPGGVPPGGVPSGGNPLGGGGPGKKKGVLEKGGPEAGGTISPGGIPGVVSNPGGTPAKMGVSVPGGRSGGAGRSRTVESTRSCGADLVDSSAPGPRSPGERSEKSESGSLSAARIISLLTLLMASRFCPTIATSSVARRDANRSTRRRLALRLATMR